MGNKVNPRGLRLGISAPWDASWFTSDKREYACRVQIERKIRELISKAVEKEILSRIVVEYRPTLVLVKIFTSKVGAVLGKGGETVIGLEKKIQAITGISTKVEVGDVKNPSCDAQLVASGIAGQLESRASFRRVMKKAMSFAMKSGGCKGIKIACKGRLSGAEIARREWYKEGAVTLHTLKAKIDYAGVDAHTSYGTIGVKVWVYTGDISGPGDYQIL